MADDIESTGAPTFDASRFRQVLGHFATGITVVTTVDEGEPIGFTAQSFLSLSLDPPLIAVCPGVTSSSLPRIRNAGFFCVNILGEDQEAHSRVFATKEPDKFAGLGWKSGVTGAPVLEGSLASIECTVEEIHDAGDHVIVVGRVQGLDVGNGDARPLLFYRGGYGRFES